MNTPDVNLNSRNLDLILLFAYRSIKYHKKT